MNSTFAFTDLHKPYGNFEYTRGGNPTRAALEDCIKSLEYGNFCIVFASGCGATTSFMHTLKSGDHIIICDDVYGGIKQYMSMFA